MSIYLFYLFIHKEEEILSNSFAQPWSTLPIVHHLLSIIGTICVRHIDSHNSILVSQPEKPV